MSASITQELAKYEVTKASINKIELFIGLLFVADASVALLGANANANDGGFYRTSLLFRAFFEYIAIAVLLLNIYDRKIFIGMITVAVLAIICFIGNGSFYLAGNEIDFIDTFLAANKYLFIFIAYPFMNLLFSRDPAQIIALKRVFKYIIFINSAAIILGFLFGIPLFQSYNDNRFGYKGFIYAVNEASLFYMLALFFALYEIYKKRAGCYSLLLVVICASLVLGTKASAVFSILIILSFILIFVAGLKAKIFVFLVSAGIIITTWITFDFTYVVDKIPAMQFFQYFYDKDGLWAMLLSGRNYFIEEKFIPIISTWSIDNWFFGGTNVNTHAIEMDFHDLFLLFGFVGSVIYVIAYVRLLYIREQKSFSIFLMIFYFLVAGLGGHVFYSSMNVLYLCILLLIIKYSYANPSDLIDKYELKI